VTNPWLKKNPFMSMWLSAFNTVAGSVQGHAMQQAKRQAASSATRATKTVFDAWTAGVKPTPAKRKRKR